MELSTGNAVAEGVWQLSAADLPYAWVAPPAGFVGSAHLVAELQLPNSQIVDRQSIHLEWTQGRHEVGTVTNAPTALEHPNDPAPLTARPDMSVNLPESIPATVGNRVSAFANAETMTYAPL